MNSQATTSSNTQNTTMQSSNMQNDAMRSDAMPSDAVRSDAMPSDAMQDDAMENPIEDSTELELKATNLIKEVRVWFCTNEATMVKTFSECSDIKTDHTKDHDIRHRSYLKLYIKLINFCGHLNRTKAELDEIVLYAVNVGKLNRKMFKSPDSNRNKEWFVRIRILCKELQEHHCPCSDLARVMQELRYLDQRIYELKKETNNLMSNPRGTHGEFIRFITKKNKNHGTGRLNTHIDTDSSSDDSSD